LWAFDLDIRKPHAAAIAPEFALLAVRIAEFGRCAESIRQLVAVNLPSPNCSNQFFAAFVPLGQDAAAIMAL